MAKITISHEFDLKEESDEIKTLMNAKEYSETLYRLDDNLRAMVKYGEEEWLTEDVCEYLDSLRSMIPKWSTQ